jgi:hypothetical protein
MFGVGDGPIKLGGAVFPKVGGIDGSEEGGDVGGKGGHPGGFFPLAVLHAVLFVHNDYNNI